MNSCYGRNVKEPTIDISKVIIREPLIYVSGVYCKTKKQQLYYKAIGVIITILGVVGTLCVMSLVFYHYLT